MISEHSKHYNDPDRNKPLAQARYATGDADSKLAADLARAVRALTRAGFEDLGGQEWKPPIGPQPRFVPVADTAMQQQNADLLLALREVAGNFDEMRAALEETRRFAVASRVSQENIDLVLGHLEEIAEVVTEATAGTYVPIEACPNCFHAFQPVISPAAANAGGSGGGMSAQAGHIATFTVPEGIKQVSGHLAGAEFKLDLEGSPAANAGAPGSFAYLVDALGGVPSALQEQFASPAANAGDLADQAQEAYYYRHLTLCAQGQGFDGIASALTELDQLRKPAEKAGGLSETQKYRAAYGDGVRAAAKLCDEKYQARAASGHPREASAARSLAEEIRNLQSTAPRSTAADAGGLIVGYVRQSSLDRLGALESSTATIYSHKQAEDYVPLVRPAANGAGGQS